MYNRYIPQTDGSHHRQTVQNSQPHSQKGPAASKQIPPSPPSEHQHQTIENKSCNAFSFLKDLLPKEFDTADLFIVLLLLLMAGDSENEKTNALLTLALYFFM